MVKSTGNSQNSIQWIQWNQPIFREASSLSGPQQDSAPARWKLCRALILVFPLGHGLLVRLLQPCCKAISLGHSGAWFHRGCPWSHMNGSPWDLGLTCTNTILYHGPKMGTPRPEWSPTPNSIWPSEHHNRRANCTCSQDWPGCTSLGCCTNPQPSPKCQNGSKLHPADRPRFRVPSGRCYQGSNPQSLGPPAKRSF